MRGDRERKCPARLVTEHLHSALFFGGGGIAENFVK